MVKFVGLIAAVLVLILLGVAANQPPAFSVERSIDVKAPPEAIFPLINDFHKWASWSPWEMRDPGMKRTYSGPAGGIGAAYAWDGNSKVGMGKMEITESSAPSKVVLRLDFLKPFKTRNTTVFTLTPAGGYTRVRWVMTGPNTFITNLIHMFVSMDKMIGKDFESGLANLKFEAERASQSSPAPS